MTRAACSIALLVGLLTGTAAFADGLSADRVRALVEKGEILPLEEILKRNEPDTVGGSSRSSWSTNAGSTCTRSRCCGPTDATGSSRSTPAPGLIVGQE